MKRLKIRKAIFGLSEIYNTQRVFIVLTLLRYL